MEKNIRNIHEKGTVYVYIKSTLETLINILIPLDIN